VPESAAAAASGIIIAIIRTATTNFLKSFLAMMHSPRM